MDLRKAKILTFRMPGSSAKIVDPEAEKQLLTVVQECEEGNLQVLSELLIMEVPKFAWLGNFRNEELCPYLSVKKPRE